MGHLNTPTDAPCLNRDGHERIRAGDDVRREASGEQQSGSNGSEASFVGHARRKRDLGRSPAFLKLPFPPLWEDHNQR